MSIAPMTCGHARSRTSAPLVAAAGWAERRGSTPTAARRASWARCTPKRSRWGWWRTPVGRSCRARVHVAANRVDDDAELRLVRGKFWRGRRFDVSSSRWKPAIDERVHSHSSVVCSRRLVSDPRIQEGSCLKGGARTTRKRASVSALVLVACMVACVDEHHAVVSTAAGAVHPWTCPEQSTRVLEVSGGRYQLTGCGRTAVYDCNFSFQPPRCWRWSPRP